MSVSERIQLIISENKLKQTEFAQSIKVTDSYISKLIRGESGLSKPLASLIEELYGYSADWILEGTEPMMGQHSKTRNLTPIQRRVIFEVEHIDDPAELTAIMSFIKLLGDYKEALNIESQ